MLLTLGRPATARESSDLVHQFYKDVPPPENVTDIFIGGMYPMSGAWSGGKTLVPVIEYSLAMINERSDILPGYRLVLHWGDTKESTSHPD